MCPERSIWRACFLNCAIISDFEEKIGNMIAQLSETTSTNSNSLTPLALIWAIAMVVTVIVILILVRVISQRMKYTEPLEDERYLDSVRIRSPGA